MSWGEVSCNCLRMKNPFRYFKTSPEIIRLAVMMQVHFPLSLRNVEDLLHERGVVTAFLGLASSTIGGLIGGLKPERLNLNY